MTDEQIHLHNEFLLCLFNKVRGLATATPSRPVKSNSTPIHTDKDKTLKEKRLKLKRKYKTDRSNFEVSINKLFIDIYYYRIIEDNIYKSHI